MTSKHLIGITARGFKTLCEALDEDGVPYTLTRAHSITRGEMAWNFDADGTTVGTVFIYDNKPAEYAIDIAALAKLSVEEKTT